ncbi:MAG: nitrous oxide-stimulated promoter family protein [Clostridiales bacterium]
MPKNRIDFEKKLLRKMITMYCKGKKHGGPLCPDCRRLLDYASQRLDACIFGNNKTFCSKCTVHCYKPAMRDSIKKVMRYSGPRLIYCDPLAALRHIFNK